MVKSKKGKKLKDILYFFTFFFLYFFSVFFYLFTLLPFYL